MLYSCFLDDGNAINQIGFFEGALDGNLTLHQVRQDHAAIFALNGHDVLHDDGFRGQLIAVNSGKTHKKSPLLDIQAGKNCGQAQVALFKIGHGGHDLLVGHVAAGLFQLLCQIGQLLGMSGIVADHVLHQSQQLVHGSVLTGSAAVALVAALMVMVMMMVTLVVMMMAAVMGMRVLVTLTVQMIVIMGMVMIVLMAVGVGMGMGNTVVGVLMGMGMFVVVAVTADVIMMNMHMVLSLHFFFYYTDSVQHCQNIYFPAASPLWACVWRANQV